MCQLTVQFSGEFHPSHDPGGNRMLAGAVVITLCRGPPKLIFDYSSFLYLLNFDDYLILFLLLRFVHSVQMLFTKQVIFFLL